MHLTASQCCTTPLHKGGHELIRSEAGRPLSFCPLPNLSRFFLSSPEGMPSPCRASAADKNSASLCRFCIGFASGAGGPICNGRWPGAPTPHWSDFQQFTASRQRHAVVGHCRSGRGTESEDMIHCPWLRWRITSAVAAAASRASTRLLRGGPRTNISPLGENPSYPAQPWQCTCTMLLNKLPIEPVRKCMGWLAAKIRESS